VNIVLGILFLGFGMFIFFNTQLGALALVVFLGIDLIILGIENFTQIPFDEQYSKTLVIIDIFLGILTTVLGFLVIAFPNIGIDLVILLTAITLSLHGILVSYLTISFEALSRWVKH
jgi:uncharacterized membrane protein HdeD (DUF308 family)